MARRRISRGARRRRIYLSVVVFLNVDSVVARACSGTFLVSERQRSPPSRCSFVVNCSALGPGQGDGSAAGSKTGANVFREAIRTISPENSVQYRTMPSSSAILRHPWTQCSRQLHRRHKGIRYTRSLGPRIEAALLDPPAFNPSKLKVLRLGSDGGFATSDASSSNGGNGTSNGTGNGTINGVSSTVFRRRYTLTHNDLTGYLTLSIGKEYNHNQLSGWYTKILRDEVLAEWIVSRSFGAGSRSSPDGAAGLIYELHVYCHVSGEELWPAPAGLRSFIFQREMTLVLDTIAYADREMIGSDPVLESALVYVHLASDLEPLNKKIAWGRLGDKSTWKKRVSKRSLVDVLFSTDEEEDEEAHDDVDHLAFEEIANSHNAATVALKSKE